MDTVWPWPFPFLSLFPDLCIHPSVSVWLTSTDGTCDFLGNAVDARATSAAVRKIQKCLRGELYMSHCPASQAFPPHRAHPQWATGVMGESRSPVPLQGRGIDSEEWSLSRAPFQIELSLDLRQVQPCWALSHVLQASTILLLFFSWS